MVVKIRTALENLPFRNSHFATIREKTLSFLLLSHHLFRYRIASYPTLIEKGTLIVSIDIDVGNKAVGVLNRGKNDRNVSSQLSEYAVGKVEEAAVPLMIEFFEEIQVPVTFAIRGQLLEVDSTLLNLLLESPIKHDIAAHGYYHREFNKLSIDETEEELKMISKRMKEFGITPRTLIFPRNSVAHLELLEKYNYLCYRGQGGFTMDGMYIVKKGGLYDVHPSLFINRNVSIRLLKKMLDISISKKSPFHLWFHTLDFGLNERDVKKGISRVLTPFFKCAIAKERDGLLAFHNMLSMTEQLCRSDMRAQLND